MGQMLGCDTCCVCSVALLLLQSHAVRFADLFAEESREVLLDLHLAAAPQEGQQALIKVSCCCCCCPCCFPICT
jgi:hypothetical protein